MNRLGLAIRILAVLWLALESVNAAFELRTWIEMERV